MVLINKEKYFNIVENGKREDQVALYKPVGNLEKDAQLFRLFARRFYSRYFFYKDANFHKDIYKGLVELQSLDIDELSLIGARDTAKTAIVKIWVVYATIYKLYNFGVVASKDKKKSTKFVTDVFNMLSEPLIMQTYGNIFGFERYETKKRRETMAEFDTRHGVKLMAISSLVSIRGEITDAYRPDLYIGDDFENLATLGSLLVTTPRIWEFRDEAINAMNLSKKKVINLANYLSEAGNVHKIVNNHKGKENKRLMIIPVVKDGVIQWQDKIVNTKLEAKEINKTRTLDNRVISLEMLKEDSENYLSEYMCEPAKFGDLEFNKEAVMKCYNAKTPITITDDGLRVYEEYEDGGVYGIGADTSEGIGKDSNTAVIVRFDCSPFRIVGIYDSNTIDPDEFGELLAVWGKEYGEAIIAPEINNTGFAVVASLRKGYPIERIYQPKREDKENDSKTGSLGFRTTASSKTLAITDAKRIINDGSIEIPEMGMIDEIVSYTRQDKVSLKPTPTRHFDLFIAFIIALQLKDSDVYVGVGFA